LKCLFKTSKLFKLFNLLDSSSDDLLLAFCEATDVINTIVHFKVINIVLVVEYSSRIFIIFAFSMIIDEDICEKDSSLIYSSKLSIERS
jgi:hypothetical protein